MQMRFLAGKTRFKRDGRAVTPLEYVIIAAMIVVVILDGVTNLEHGLPIVFTKVFTKISSEF